MNTDITFSLFLSIRALEAILRSKTYRKILFNREVSIYLDASVEELKDAIGPVIEESRIGDYLVSKCCSGGFYLANEMIAEILNNPARFSQFPFSLFILDISRVDARKIRKQYGVLCYSDQASLRLATLRFQKTVFCEKGSPAKSWPSILTEASRFPVNTIIINDRYLMLGNPDIAERNVRDIVSSLLPASDYEGTVNVFFYFDGVDEKWSKNFIKEHEGENLDEMNQAFMIAARDEFGSKSRRVCDFVRTSVNGSYAVRTICSTYHRPLEVNRSRGSISMKTWVSGYDLTHNRRIITDYFHITADHGLQAFNMMGKAENEQLITTKGLYCEGLNDPSDLPEERHRVMLSNYARMMDSESLFLSVDGDVLDDQYEIWRRFQSIPIFRQNGDMSGTLRVR